MQACAWSNQKPKRASPQPRASGSGPIVLFAVVAARPTASHPRPFPRRPCPSIFDAIRSRRDRHALGQHFDEAPATKKRLLARRAAVQRHLTRAEFRQQRRRTVRPCHVVANFDGLSSRVEQQRSRQTSRTVSRFELEVSASWLFVAALIFSRPSTLVSMPPLRSRPFSDRVVAFLDHLLELSQHLRS